MEQIAGTVPATPAAGVAVALPGVEGDFNWLNQPREVVQVRSSRVQRRSAAVRLLGAMAF